MQHGLRDTHRRLVSRARWRALLGGVALLACAASAGAATSVLDSESFEAPAYGPGALPGQQGWLAFGSPSTTADVQSAVAFRGAQSVRVDRAPSADAFFAVPLASVPSGRGVSISWAMRVAQAASPVPGQFGPFFAVSAFDDSSGTIGLLASLGVDATTGDVLFQQTDTGFLLETGVVAPFDQWARYRIDLDFQDDTFRAFVDGVEVVGPSGFVERGLGLDALTDADITAIAAGGDPASQQATGSAFFDDFRVLDGLLADYSNNGVVDAADYTLWRDRTGSANPATVGDGNLDGVVNNADYTVWASAFGDTNSAAAVALPEPAGAALLAGGLAIIARRRR